MTWAYTLKEKNRELHLFIIKFECLLDIEVEMSSKPRGETSLSELILCMNVFLYFRFSTTLHLSFIFHVISMHFPCHSICFYNSFIVLLPVFSLSHL